MTLHEKIYRLRKRLGLSQEELASRLQVSRQTISNWETGAANPEISKLSRLAEILGVTVDFLLDEEATLSDPEEDEAGESRGQAGAGGGGAQQASVGKSYPDWLDHLPGFLRRGAHRFGWLLGLYIALGGVAMIVISCVQRSMLTATLGPTGSWELGMGDLPPELVSGFDGDLPMTPPKPKFTDSIYTIPNVVLIIGLVLLVVGCILGVSLKKWGKRHQAEDEASREA